MLRNSPRPVKFTNKLKYPAKDLDQPPRKFFNETLQKLGMKERTFNNTLRKLWTLISKEAKKYNMQNLSEINGKLFVLQ